MDDNREDAILVDARPVDAIPEDARPAGDALGNGPNPVDFRGLCLVGFQVRCLDGFQDLCPVGYRDPCRGDHQVRCPVGYRGPCRDDRQVRCQGGYRGPCRDDRQVLCLVGYRVKGPVESRVGSGGNRQQRRPCRAPASCWDDSRSHSIALGSEEKAEWRERTDASTASSDVSTADWAESTEATAGSMESTDASTDVWTGSTGASRGPTDASKGSMDVWTAVSTEATDALKDASMASKDGSRAEPMAWMAAETADSLMAIDLRKDGSCRPGSCRHRRPD